MKIVKLKKKLVVRAYDPFLDALNFGTEPGKITLTPLQMVFWNSTLRHRLSSFISGKISPKRLENSYLLGVQPESTELGRRISQPVRRAVHRIIKELESKRARRINKGTAVGKNSTHLV